MSSYLMVQLAGALIITFLLNRALHYSFRKTQEPIRRALYVAGAGIVVAVGIPTLTMGFKVAVTTYLPFVVVWLLIDLVRAQRKKPTGPGSDGAAKCGSVSVAFR